MELINFKSPKLIPALLLIIWVITKKWLASCLKHCGGSSCLTARCGPRFLFCAAMTNVITQGVGLTRNQRAGNHAGTSQDPPQICDIWLRWSPLWFQCWAFTPVSLRLDHCTDTWAQGIWAWLDENYVFLGSGWTGKHWDLFNFMLKKYMLYIWDEVVWKSILIELLRQNKLF